MVIQEKLFPSQGQEERIFLLIRKHWFNYTVFFLLSFLSIVPVFVTLFVWVNNPSLALTVGGEITIVALGIFVLSVLAAQLYGFVDYYLDVYIVTDQRVVDISQEGYFKRQISELHLHQVQDVNASVEGIWQTLLHFGDVHIQTAGERENFIFKSIPHPYLVAKQIISLHEAHIERNTTSLKKANIKKEEWVNNDEEKGLPFVELEKQAKGMLDQSKFMDRVKSGGTVTADDIKISDADEKKNKTPKSVKVTNPKPKKVSEVKKDQIKAKDITSENQGELTEGREIDLE